MGVYSVGVGPHSLFTELGLSYEERLNRVRIQELFYRSECGLVVYLGWRGVDLRSSPLQCSSPILCTIPKLE
jgi:hypothetical protein